MKYIYLIILVQLVGLTCLAQDTTKKTPSNSVEFYLKPNIEKAFSAITLETPIDAIKGYFKDNKDVLVRAKEDKLVFKYKMLFKTDGDILKVDTKSASANTDFFKNYANIKSDEQTLFFRTKYVCTDNRHNPRDEARTIDEMKSIVEQKKCSGYTILLSSSTDVTP